MTAVLRYAGYGNESEPGTAVPAQVAADITGASLDAPQNTEILYPGGLRRGHRTRRPGFYMPAGNTVQGANWALLARFLYYALGGYTYTLGTHEAYASEDPTPPYFTTRIGKDEFEHVFAGCAVGSLVLAVSDGYLTATPEITAWTDAEVAIDAIADIVALLDDDPIVFSEVSLEIPAATDVSALCRDLSFTIQNNMRSDAGRSIGSRFARRSVWGDRDVTFQATLKFAGDDELARFWGGAAAPAVTGATDFATLITATDAVSTLTLDMQSCHYEQVSQPVSGRDELLQTVRGRAILADHTTIEPATVVTEVLATVEDDATSVAAVA